MPRLAVDAATKCPPYFHGETTRSQQPASTISDGPRPKPPCPPRTRISLISRSCRNPQARPKLPGLREKVPIVWGILPSIFPGFTEVQSDDEENLDSFDWGSDMRRGHERWLGCRGRLAEKAPRIERRLVGLVRWIVGRFVGLAWFERWLLGWLLRRFVGRQLLEQLARLEWRIQRWLEWRQLLARLPRRIPRFEWLARFERRLGRVRPSS